MHVSRLCFIAIVCVFFCTACAYDTTTAPKKRPKNLRLSIRHLNKGAQFYNKGCFTKAVRHFREAHERFAAGDNLKGAANSLNSLANAYYRLNDTQRAIPIYDEAVALYQYLGDRRGRVRALTNKSATLASSGELVNATAVLDQADSLAQQESTLVGLRLKTRAILLLKKNDLEGAKKLLFKVIHTIPIDARQQASVHYTMGYALLLNHQPKKAIRHLNKAFEADQNANAYFGIAQDLEALGDCHMQLKEAGVAVTYFKRSIKIFALLNNIQKVQLVSYKLTKNASEAGIDVQTTLSWAAQWLAGRRETGICR